VTANGNTFQLRAIDRGPYTSTNFPQLRNRSTRLHSSADGELATRCRLRWKRQCLARTARPVSLTHGARLDDSSVFTPVRRHSISLTVRGTTATPTTIPQTTSLRTSVMRFHACCRRSPNAMAGEPNSILNSKTANRVNFSPGAAAKQRITWVEGEGSRQQHRSSSQQGNALFCQSHAYAPYLNPVFFSAGQATYGNLHAPDRRTRHSETLTCLSSRNTPPLTRNGVARTVPAIEMFNVFNRTNLWRSR